MIVLACLSWLERRTGGGAHRLAGGVCFRGLPRVCHDTGGCRWWREHIPLHCQWERVGRASNFRARRVPLCKGSLWNLEKRFHSFSFRGQFRTRLVEWGLEWVGLVFFHVLQQRPRVRDTSAAVSGLQLPQVNGKPDALLYYAERWQSALPPAFDKGQDFAVLQPIEWVQTPSGQAPLQCKSMTNNFTLDLP